MKLIKKITNNREEAIKRVRFIMEREPITASEITQQQKANNKILSDMNVAAMSGCPPTAEIKFRDIKDIPEKRIQDEMYSCYECNAKTVLYEYSNDGDKFFLCSKCRQKMKDNL